MTKKLAALLALVLLFSLAGCGQSPAATEETLAATEALLATDPPYQTGELLESDCYYIPALKADTFEEAMALWNQHQDKLSRDEERGCSYIWFSDLVHEIGITHYDDGMWYVATMPVDHSSWSELVYDQDGTFLHKIIDGYYYVETLKADSFEDAMNMWDLYPDKRVRYEEQAADALWLTDGVHKFDILHHDNGNWGVTSYPRGDSNWYRKMYDGSGTLLYEMDNDYYCVPMLTYGTYEDIMALWDQYADWRFTTDDGEWLKLTDQHVSLLFRQYFQRWTYGETMVADEATMQLYVYEQNSTTTYLYTAEGTLEIETVEHRDGNGHAIEETTIDYAPDGTIDVKFSARIDEVEIDGVPRRIAVETRYEHPQEGHTTLKVFDSATATFRHYNSNHEDAGETVYKAAGTGVYLLSQTGYTEDIFGVREYHEEIFTYDDDMTLQSYTHTTYNLDGTLLKKTEYVPKGGRLCCAYRYEAQMDEVGNLIDYSETTYSFNENMTPHSCRTVEYSPGGQVLREYETIYSYSNTMLYSYRQVEYSPDGQITYDFTTLCDPEGNEGAYVEELFFNLRYSADGKWEDLRIYP